MEACVCLSICLAVRPINVMDEPHLPPFHPSIYPMKRILSRAVARSRRLVKGRAGLVHPLMNVGHQEEGRE